MVDVTIPNLPSATALDGTELFPVVQGGTTKRAPLSAIPSAGGGLSPTAAQTITGLWTYTTAPVLPDGALTTDMIAGLGGYVDGRRGQTTVRLVKQTATGRASTNTPTLDPDLNFPAAAGDAWDISLYLEFDGDPTADFKWTVTVPAGSTIHGTAAGLTTAAVSVSSSQAWNTLSGPPASNVLQWGIYASATDCSGRIDATVQLGATAGTIGLSWAQGTANATATTLHAGSNLLGVLQK